MATETLNIKINATDAASPKMTKLQGAMSGLKTAVIGLGVAFALVKIKDFLKESVQLYLVQEKAEARLKASISNLKDLGSGYEKTEENVKKVTDELKAYASQLQKVTTFGDENIISAQAMLGTFQLNAEEIKLLTPSLLDMAAATEKTSGAQADLNDLANAMGKALNTGTGALSRYGVVLTEAQKAQFDTATGMERVAMLAEILGDNFGGAAEEIRNTTAGALAAAANDWGDFKEKVGQILAPMLAAIAGWISDIATTLQEWMGRIGEAWESDWGGVRTTITEVWTFIQDEVFPLIVALWNLISEVLGFIKEKWNTDWIGIRTILSTAWDLMKIVVGTALEVIADIINIATAILSGDWGAAWNGIKQIFIDIWEGMKDFVMRIVDAIIGKIQEMIRWIKDAITELATLGFAETTTFNSVPRSSSEIPMTLSAPRASGGSVFSGMPYLVGEKGAELFVPGNSGSIVPNSKLGGITINISGVISSKEVAEEYADIIVRKLQLSSSVV